MSKLKYEMAKKRFFGLIAMAPVSEFLQMIWAVDALQSGRASQAAKYIQFPREAETNDAFSQYFAHKWRLETLANEGIIHSFRARGLIIKRRLNCQNFSAFVEVNNRLNALENSEEFIGVKDESVFDELYRLTQRQFEWQIGFVSLSAMYRFAFVFGGPVSRAFYYEKYHFFIEDLSLFCFACRAALMNSPFIDADFNFRQVGLEDEKRDLIIRHIKLDMSAAKAEARRLRDVKERIAYRPSILRNYPLIEINISGKKHLSSPLIDLLCMRSAGNLFFDFASAPQSIRTETGSRFEIYCFDLLQAALKDHDVSKSFKYYINKNIYEFSDLYVRSSFENSVIIIECKSTRMSFDAKFSEDPIAVCERGYNEMAKGVAQIWRAVSHIRRGYILKSMPTQKYGIVLTLDNWLTMYHRKSRIFDKAHKIAVEKDSEIIDEDKIDVLFCTIDDLEAVLQLNKGNSLFEAVRAASSKKYLGWMLSTVHDRFVSSDTARAPYPLKNRIGEVLPWWNRQSSL